MKEREETGSVEPETDIINRLQVEAFKDPKFRMKYGHFFEIERIERRVAEQTSGRDLHTVGTACDELSEYKCAEGNGSEIEENDGQESELVTAAQQLSLEEDDKNESGADYNSS